jgi:hypothetical protein
LADPSFEIICADKESPEILGSGEQSIDIALLAIQIKAFWEMVLFRRRTDIASMAFSFTSCSVAISSHPYSSFKQSQGTVILLLSPQRRLLPPFYIPPRVFACGHAHAPAHPIKKYLSASRE